MLEEERAHVERLIFEMTSGYFGWDEEHIRRADTIEIKIGQSAKAGSGGLLPATKVTERIAQVRGLRAGEDAHSPARFPDIHTVAELRARVEEIRALVEGRPVGIKFAAGRGEEDLAAAIDGRGGGTGAAPVVLKHNLTVPIQYALHRARAPRGADDLDIVATGFFRTSADVTKAIAMGATAVAMATASMIATGCRQYLACHTGNCPVGIGPSGRTSRRASTWSCRASAGRRRCARSARRSSCCAGRSACSTSTT